MDEVVGKYNSLDSEEEWLFWLPILRKGYDTARKKQMEKYIDVALNNVDKSSGSWLELFREPQFTISFVPFRSPDERIELVQREEYIIGKSNLLKWIPMPLKSLRFTYE